MLDTFYKLSPDIYIHTVMYLHNFGWLRSVLPQDNSFLRHYNIFPCLLIYLWTIVLSSKCKINSESAQYREKSVGFRMWRPLALGGDQRGKDKNDVETEITMLKFKAKRNKVGH